MDIIITGSSRPSLLKITLESWKKYLHTDEKLNWIYHDDVVDKSKNNEIIKVVESFGIDLIISDPPVGLGLSIDKLLNMKLSKYILYLQDDWELERPVELDRMAYVMDRNININQILFPKMRVRYQTGDFKHRVFTFDGLDFTINNAWYLNPAIWRMSKVRQNWPKNKDRIEGAFTNAFGTHKQRLDYKYCYNNLGSFFLGAIDEYRYVRHLGATFRNENFRVGDRTLTFEVFEYKHMAPWLKYIKRPIDRSCGLKFSKTNLKQFYEELDKVPMEVKKHIFGNVFEYMIEHKDTIK